MTTTRITRTHFVNASHEVGSILSAALTLAVLFSSTQPAAPADRRDAVSQQAVPLIVIDEVPLPDAIRNLARQADLNYILDPRVPGSGFGPGRLAPKPAVKARWTNLSAGAALGLLLKEHKLTMVTNPATTVMRVAPLNGGVKPVPASQVGTNTNSVIPLLVMEDVPLTDAIRALAKQAGLRVVYDPKVAGDDLDLLGTVSIRWEDITARQALAAILDNYYLVLLEEPGASSVRITLKGEKSTSPRGDPGKPSP